MECDRMKKKKKQSLKFDRNTTKFKKFDYGDVIELKDLTIEDCVSLYEHGYEIVIKDGQVADLKKFK
jgi:hypothetical protein